MTILSRQDILLRQDDHWLLEARKEFSKGAILIQDNSLTQTEETLIENDRVV